MSIPSEIQLTSGPVCSSLQASVNQPLIPIPDQVISPSERCREALLNPLGYPELVRCVVPGDRVILVVDPETPFAAEIISTVWEQLQSVTDGGVLLTLLLPPDHSGTGWQWLREQFPLHVQQQITVHVHDPADSSQISYIASTSGGERIYLNRLLSDADLIITVGIIAFDGLLGFRGTSSILFPAFSDIATQQGSQSQGHPELTPEQQRPFREMIDEVGWLLGTQFTVQVIPGAAGLPAEILAGLPEDVMTRGKELVDRTWRVSVEEMLEGAVISVPGGAFGWKQLGQALENTTNIVQQGGRIVIVADLPIPEGPAATMLRRCQDPEELLKPLRREPTVDSIEFAQLIQALRRVRVYLLSQLPAELVEELGMIPVSDSAELQRLVATIEDCKCIPLANYAWCEVA
ncbi:MAG: lactate racemase domain-containing protein [Planctomycetaceae bacterium]